MSEEKNIEEQGFVHLHCHSDYSLYDGFQKIGKMVSRAAELGMKGIAITDHGKVGSYIKFYKAAKEEGIKPIFGLEAYICHDVSKNNNPRFHLTILAKNKIGYMNLLKLASKSHNHIARIFGNEIPRITPEMLKEHSEGLIVLSGCIASEFSDLIVSKGKYDEAEALAKDYKDIWGKDFYIEVMWAKYKPQLLQMKHAEQIAKKLDIKIVATNDVHYSYREDAKHQASKIALSRGKPYCAEGESSEYYIKSYEEMKKIFNNQRIDYLHNTMSILDECDVELELGKAQLPHFEVPKNNEDFNNWKQKVWRKNEEETYLQYLSEMGLKNLGLWDSSGYKERLFKELETIRFTGFTRYFLIVWEYCYWSRLQNIRIGKGRGCFTERNKVIKSNGECCCISDIKLGDLVISHDGSKNEVLEKFEYEVDEELLILEMEDGRIIECTEDHEIYVKENGKEIWKKAKDIKDGDDIVEVL